MTPNEKKGIIQQVVNRFQKNVNLYRSLEILLGEYILPGLFPDAQKTAARVKDPDSIAGKALKKYIHIGDAEAIFRKFTDFVGARVIFLRRDQVDAADAVVREFFIVDDHDSQNTVERLNDHEFGYQSRHYIVCINQAWIDNIRHHRAQYRIPEELFKDISLKTESVFIELQIRTWLQHVWADLSHDSIYKGDRMIPRELMRSWNALAAILENVDEDIVRCLDQLEQYRKNSAYYVADEIDRKIGSLEIIAGIQLRQYLDGASSLKRASHRIARSFLELLHLHHLKGDNISDLRALLRSIGRDEPGFSRKEKELIEAIEGAAVSPASTEKELTAPRELLQFLLKMKGQQYDDPYLPPLLQISLKRCEDMVRSCSELPWAFAGKVFFRMLLMEEKHELQSDENVEAVYDAVLRLIDLCNERSLTNLTREKRVATRDAKEALLTLRDSISKERFQHLYRSSNGAAPLAECVEEMLKLGCFAHGISKEKICRKRPAYPAVIIAGGCASLTGQPLKDFKELFAAALQGNTTIHFYTGEGRQGICSLDFGKMVSRFGKGGYRVHSIWEALLEWRQLQADGYRFDDVALVGFGLGRLSSIECRMALAFGARVTVIGHKDFLDYARTLEGLEHWSNHPSLVRLPLIRSRSPQNVSFSQKKATSSWAFSLNLQKCGFPEPIMLRVFMIFKPYHEIDYTSSKRDTLLKLIHRIKELKTKHALRPIEDIDITNQRSARHRLLFFEALYQDAHGRRKPDGKVRIPSEKITPSTTLNGVREWISKFSIEDPSIDYTFGEREHARWYIERWLQGTRYGTNKIDCGVPADQRRNPCMKAWADLDDDTITKDTEFISRYLIAKQIEKSPEAVNIIARFFRRSDE